MDYTKLEEALKSCAKETEMVLDLLLPCVSTSLDFLQEAMRYSALMTGGHRWRPFVLRQFVGALGYSGGSVEYEKISLHVGAAIEMIHNYSLIHDDLPCIDNDVKRRDVDACHVKFGESIALLAGNGLLCEAFRIITDLSGILTPAKVIQIIENMARESGPNGMVQGQCIDMIARSDIKCTDEEYKMIKKNIFKKTTSLFILSCSAAGIICNANDHYARILGLYGQNLGKMYQVLDDIEDETGVDGFSLEKKIIAHRDELEDYASSLADLVKIFPDSDFKSNLSLLPYYLYARYTEKWNN